MLAGLAICSALCGSVEADSIKWVGERDARKAMMSSGKVCWVYFSRTGCGPCRQFEKLLTLPDVVKKLEMFVCVKIPHGRSRAWGVTKFPSSVFCHFNESGRLVIVAVSKGTRSIINAKSELKFLAQLSSGLAATQQGKKD